MALPPSGELTFQDLTDEFNGGTTPVVLSDYYRGGGLVPNTTANNGVPTSGQISLSDFYGATDSLAIQTVGSRNASINTATDTFTIPCGTAGTKLIIIGISHAMQSSTQNARAIMDLAGNGLTEAVYSMQGDKNCGIHYIETTLTGNQTLTVTLYEPTLTTTRSARGFQISYARIVDYVSATPTATSNTYLPGAATSINANTPAGGFAVCVGNQINGSIVGGAPSGWTLIDREINNSCNGGHAYQAPATANTAAIAWPNDPYTAEVTAAWN